MWDKRIPIIKVRSDDVKLEYLIHCLLRIGKVVQLDQPFLKLVLSLSMWLCSSKFTKIEQCIEENNVAFLNGESDSSPLCNALRME